MADPSPPGGIPARGDDEDRALVGQTVDGRYRIDAVVGRGGMGTVYRAEHVRIQRPVAFKRLHPRLSNTDAFEKRFEREAVAVGRVDHPNCVGISDFGELADGSLYLVMEYLEGRSLGDLLDEYQRLPPARALHIMRHVMRGLAHAHAQGVVHRDIKPDNIYLVQRDGDADFAKVVDFGIAKLVGPAESEGDQGLTKTGVAIGTPKYLAPEQAFGDTTDGRTDLYSASVVLYEMVAGVPPFEADDSIALVTKHLTSPVPPLAQAAPGVPLPAGLEQLVQRGLAKERDQRFGSAEEYIAAIDAIAGQGPAVRLSSPVPTQAPRMSSPVPAQAMRQSSPVPAQTAPLSGYEHTMAVHTPLPWTHPARARRKKWIYGGIGALVAAVVLGIAVGGDGGAKLDELTEQLEKADTCEARREAVIGLRHLGDKRAIKALKKARYRMRGGLAGIGDKNTNACLKKDAEAAFQHLESL